MKEKLISITKSLDIPTSQIEALPIIEIMTADGVLIENHRGVLEYTGEQIDIAGKNLIIRINGTNLDLKSMTAEEIFVSGCVKSVEIIR